MDPVCDTQPPASQRLCRVHTLRGALMERPVSFVSSLRCKAIRHAEPPPLNVGRRWPQPNCMTSMVPDSMSMTNNR